MEHCDLIDEILMTLDSEKKVYMDVFWTKNGWVLSVLKMSHIMEA